MPSFVAIGDIKGESKDSGHKKWIYVDGDYGGTERSKPSPSHRRRRGPVDLDDIPDLIRKPTPPSNNRTPVWFRIKLWRYFPRLFGFHSEGRPCEGWFEFTDSSGRVLHSMEFREGRIIRLSVLPAAGGGGGPGQFEIGLVAEKWQLHNGPCPASRLHGRPPVT